jgi:ATP-dependent HslUV protease, peptidase subunit HslV
VFLGCGRAKRYNRGMPISGRSGQWRDRKARAQRIRSTTVLCVRKDNKVVMVGDGQVTVGEHVMKHSAKKTRRMFDDKVLAGFAGSTADAFSLFGRFENKLQEFHGNLSRAAVELAKEWRTDRALRHLDALLVVADTKGTFLLSGHGDVIEPDDGICAIGSGGPYALSAARALAKNTKMSAKEIAMEAMQIASEICIFTNGNFTVEEL